MRCTEWKRGNRLRGWIALVVLLFPAASYAVPAFARKYETSCATCHQAWPRLNAVGESFRLTGYRFADEEKYRKAQPIEMGDEAYKQLWPRALWPTDVPRFSPLSIVTRMIYEGDLDGDRPTRHTYLFPEEIEFVWTGTLGESISLYGDVIFLQKDFGGVDPVAWATLKGWIQFQGLLGDNLANVRVGTIGTQTTGLFTGRDANFYGSHFYLYTSVLMPRPTAEALRSAGVPCENAITGPCEFEGNNFAIGPGAGIEVNGIVAERGFYALGLVNGGLTAPAGGPPESDIVIFGMGDGGGKDAYLQLAYKLGGLPFDRSRLESAQSLTPGPHYWRDDSLTLSLFGYRGQAEIRVNDDVRDDTFWRAGAGIQGQWRDFTLGGVYVQGRNDRPYGLLSSGAVDSRAWHVEALWFAYPWLMPFARYEVFEWDLPSEVRPLLTFPDQDSARVMFGGKSMIRPNVGLVLEAAFYTEGGDELEPGFDGTLFGLLSVGF